MCKVYILLFGLLTLILAAPSAFAVENQPLLAKPGKLMFEDDFSRPDLKPKWRVGKGAWSVKDGVVSANELPEDHHGAYAYINPNVEYKDIVAEYSFKMGGATKLHLMMEDSKYKGAHAGLIIRASVWQKFIELVDMKNGSMKNEHYEKLNDPKTTPEEKKALQAKLKSTIAAFKVTVDPNTWHKARVEVVGDEMLMSIDGTPVAYFKAEGIDHPAKNMIGFTVGGTGGQIKDFKVWQATSADGWSAKRAEIIANLKKQ
jgi:hypothetical protein